MGYDLRSDCDAVLTQKKRSTLRGRQEWNGMMVATFMKNERRWGDLEARKSIVVDYKLGKVTKNNGNRCSAYVPEHHEAIVSPGNCTGCTSGGIQQEEVRGAGVLW